MALRQPTFLDADGFREEMALTDELQLGGLTMSGDIAMGANSITGLADPVNAQDAATKAYADALFSGFNQKYAVRLATTADLGATYNSTGGAGGTGQFTGAPTTIDGVTLAAGDYILVKDQSAGLENGIYIVTATTSTWDRADFFDSDAEVEPGAFVFVTEGTANAGNGYVLTGVDPVLNTDPLVFTQFSESTAYTFDAGLVLSGNSVSIELDTAADAQGAGADGGSSGLEYDVSGAAGKLRAKVDPDGGIQRSAAGLALELDPAGAVATSAAGVAVNVDGSTITIVGNQLVAAGASEAQRVENDFTSSEALTAGDPVFQETTNDNVGLADAAVDSEAKRVIGIAAATVGAAASVAVISNGLAAGAITGLGFAAGDLIYLANGGGLTNTAPSTGGDRIVLIGHAKNATDLMVEIAYLGKKAA